MDFCDICLDPPRPLEGRITGAVRLDAVEREPVRVRYQYLFAGETLTGEAAPA